MVSRRVLAVLTWIRLVTTGEAWREGGELWRHCRQCGGRQKFLMPRCEDCDRELGLGG